MEASDNYAHLFLACIHVDAYSAHLLVRESIVYPNSRAEGTCSSFGISVYDRFYVLSPFWACLVGQLCSLLHSP